MKPPTIPYQSTLSWWRLGRGKGAQPSMIRRSAGVRAHLVVFTIAGVAGSLVGGVNAEVAIAVLVGEQDATSFEVADNGKTVSVPADDRTDVPVVQVPALTDEADLEQWDVARRDHLDRRCCCVHHDSFLWVIARLGFRRPL